MATRLEQVRHDVRQIERFCYREVSEAEGEPAVVAARNLLRLTVGLRRLLDVYHCATDTLENSLEPSAPHKED